MCALHVARFLGGVSLLHVFANLADAVLLGWAQLPGRDLLQVVVRGGQQLSCVLTLAGGLLRTHPGSELNHGIDRATISHNFFIRGRRWASTGFPVALLLAGRFLRCLGFRLLRSRPRLGLLRFRSGLWFRFWRRRRLRLRFRAWLRWPGCWTGRRCILRRIILRRVTLRWFLGRAGRRRILRWLRLLIELRRLRLRERSEGRSRQRAKSENDGQIHAHVKLDAATPRQAYLEIITSGAWFQYCQEFIEPSRSLSD